MKLLLTLSLLLPTLVWAQGIERVANTPTDSGSFAREQVWQGQLDALRSTIRLLETRNSALSSQIVAINQLLAASPTLISGPVVVASSSTTISSTVNTTLPELELIAPACRPNEVLTSNGRVFRCMATIPTCTATQAVTANGSGFSCREIAAPAAASAPAGSPPLDCLSLGLVPYGNGCRVVPSGYMFSPSSPGGMVSTDMGGT